jgi:chromosome segregation ATPase
MIRPSTHVSLGLGDASYHPAAMSSSVAGDVIQTEMMKIHQWKMSTKMELENKENRLQLSKETIAYQTQELGRMQKINDHIGRQHSAKCEDLRKLKDEVETKTAQLQMVEQGVVQLRNTVAKQEKALGKAEKRDGITFAAVEDLALKFETCRGNKKKLEAATDRVLQSGKEIEVLENQKAELAKQLLEVGARLEASRTDLVEREEVIVQREREVDSYKALRHRELKEKSEELEALQSRCDTLDAEKAQMAEELQARQEEFTADQENVERERDEVKGENGRLAKQLCKADEELGQRIVELADEKIKIATLKENLADVTKNFAQTLQEKKEIGDILEASRKRIKDLENETADMKRYEEDIDMLRADFTASLDSLNKQQDEIQKLRKFQVENFTLQVRYAPTY